MISNFALNNFLTYGDQRLKGFKWPTGLLSFSIVCGLGTFANVGMAAYMFQENAGWAQAALAGILVGAVWNYAATSVFTWHKLR